MMCDITLCHGVSKDLDKVCNKSHKCNRFLWTLSDKVNNDYQSYFIEPPFNKKLSGQSCDYFIDSSE